MQNMNIEIYYYKKKILQNMDIEIFKKKLSCLQIPWKLKVNEEIEKVAAKWNPPEISVSHSSTIMMEWVSELLLLSFHL